MVAPSAWNGISMLTSLNKQHPVAVITSGASGSLGCGTVYKKECRVPVRLEWKTGTIAHYDQGVDTSHVGDGSSYGGRNGQANLFWFNKKIKN